MTTINGRNVHKTGRPFYSVLFYESIHVGFIIVVLFILFALNRGQTFLDNITIQWIYIYIYKKSTHICKKKKKAGF